VGPKALTVLCVEALKELLPFPPHSQNEPVEPLHELWVPIARDPIAMPFESVTENDAILVIAEYVLNLFRSSMDGFEALSKYGLDEFGRVAQPFDLHSEAVKLVGPR